MDNVLKKDFIEFLNDPGMGIAHPNKDTLKLKDFFVYPELLLPEGSPGARRLRTLSSKELLNESSLPETISLSGPEDSGKTSLLKILLIHYIENGLYPLYLDGNITGPVGEKGLWELIRTSYERQYQKSYFEGAVTSSSEKKICLFDNFDRALDDPGLAQSLLDSFRCLILASEAPLFSALEPRDKVSMIEAELCELTPSLRHELLRKWHEIDKGLNAQETDIKVQSSFDMIEKSLSREPVPSYPSVLISILYFRDTENEYAQSGGTYAHHLEHLITKQLIESHSEAEYTKLKSLVSNLAYKMFSENRSSVTGSELDELLGEDSELLTLALIKARVIVERAPGYGFKYAHNFHYFTALYIVKNLDSDETRQSVVSLCRDIGESDSTNIMLFLIHLSDDPFITQEINRALESSLPEVSENSLEDRVSELDEIIDSILSSEQKDRKLREIRAEYESLAKHPWAPERLIRGVFEDTSTSDNKEKREDLGRIYKELNLLRVSGQLLNKKISESPQSSDTKDLSRAYYRMWLRSLSSALLSLSIEPYVPAKDSGSYESSKSGTARNEQYLVNVERVTIALKIFRLYIKELSQSLGSTTTAMLLTDEENKYPNGFTKLIELFQELCKREYGLEQKEIKSLLSSREWGPFQKEVIRQVLALHYQNLFEGEELKQMLSELNRALK